MFDDSQIAVARASTYTYGTATYGLGAAPGRRIGVETDVAQGIGRCRPGGRDRVDRCRRGAGRVLHRAVLGDDAHARVRAGTRVRAAYQSPAGRLRPGLQDRR